ncbi:MAG: glutamate-1-semialdehyde 2,1-aminomutase [Planctomycetes bacterium]|nr:glutamate-1-semialdehyde 2,1-aminomutase [Planctomycetota bacterium]
MKIDDRLSTYEELRARAHRLIPGGAHTYSKGDDVYPYNAPPHLARCEGAYVWDTRGNRFLDWAMGINSVILGHAHPEVVEAVREAVGLGSNFSRPWEKELELAEKLTHLIPSAEMVKFGKNGSDATSAAVRLARAWTGRERIAVCRDHPFFSQHDWFIGMTAMPAGVPRKDRELNVGFRYNDLASVEEAFARFPGEIAAVFLEPVSMATDLPAAGFLEGLRLICDREGALLVFDEIVTGFRWHLRGAQHLFGVTPDLCTFGKAVANGFSFSFLAGKRDILELGGIRQKERDKVFLLSSTYGGESVGIAAALATIRVLEKEDAIERIWRTGRELQGILHQAIRFEGLENRVQLRGHPSNLALKCVDGRGNPCPRTATVLQESLVDEGLLAPYHCVSLAHGERELEATRVAVGRALARLAAMVRTAGGPCPRGYLLRPVFRPRND